jgi:type I restriction enzyme S subunit
MKAVEGWKQISIGEFVDLINGFAFPSEGFTEGEGKPLIRIRDLERQKTEVNFRGKYNYCYLVKKDDLLIGMDGDFQTVKWKGSDALLNQRVCKLITKSPKVLVQDFLFYRIIEEILHIHRITAATTVKHLSSKDVLGIVIDLPPKPEQAKIAEILSTVDRAIEQTEVLIAKQQRIKTGLMQDLLTRGIDEEGNLCSEQTHEFKDSPLGRIPVEWDVERLDHLLTEKRYGISTSLSDEPEGVPVLRMNNLVKGEVEYSDIKYSQRKDALKLNLNDGDILFNRTNSIDYVGRTGIYRHSGQRVSFASYLVRLVPDNARLCSEYLNFWLNDGTNQIRVKQFATIGVQQANVNPTNLGTLLIALPSSIAEQERIIESLTAVRNTIHDISKSLSKLHSLKTALMQDLLTGKKRVTLLLNETEVASL